MLNAEVSLFHATKLSALGAFCATCEVENVLVVAHGLHAFLALAFDGKLHKALHELVEWDASAFPQVERERAGDGVIFVHIDFAAACFVGLACAFNHHVYTAHAMA